MFPKDHLCDAPGVHSTPPEPSSPRQPEQPCSVAEGAWSRSPGRGAVLRGTWPTWPVSPRPAGAARRGGGTADPLSVLGAGAEVDYLEPFGASSVSTQRRAAPLTRGRLGVPGGSHPRPTWLRPQRHLLCAGLPRGTGQAGTLGTLLTLLPPLLAQKPFP